MLNYVKIRFFEDKTVIFVILGQKRLKALFSLTVFEVSIIFSLEFRSLPFQIQKHSEGKRPLVIKAWLRQRFH